MPSDSLQTYICAITEMALLEDVGVSTHQSFPLVTRKAAKSKKTFSMEEFKQLPYNEKRMYLETTLEKLGEGSSRAVFALSDELAIKFAFNVAGISQNKAESTVCAADPTREFFTKVKEKDPDFEWLIVERAAPMGFNEFEQYTGIPFVTFMSGLIGTFDEYSDSRHKENAEILLAKSKFFQKLVNIITHCKYMYGDLTRMDSWGVAHGKAVIIDSGFTESVYQAHYKEKVKQHKPHQLDEAEFPRGFDVGKLKRLPGFKQKIKYAERFFRELGSGSSRIVMAIDLSTVFKLARNSKGVAQNKVEIEVSQRPYIAIARVTDYDPDGLWLEMERAKPLTSPIQFRELTGFSWRDFQRAIEYWYRTNIQSSTEDVPISATEQEAIETTPWFQSITQMIKDFDMPFGDIQRIESWGIVNRNNKLTPVLIDYGLTEQVWQQFYRK